MPCREITAHAIGAISGAPWKRSRHEEWDDYKSKLRDAYGRLDKLFRENPTWNEDTIGGALSIVVHTAYHLGEIRQALCTLK